MDKKAFEKSLDQVINVPYKEPGPEEIGPEETIESMTSAQPDLQPTCNQLATDCISRQAAIDALCNDYCGGHQDCKYYPKCENLKSIQKLPSAQTEIIRCTECKHYREYDSEYVENAVVVQCMADRYPISETIPDGWFCAGAERKDDE